MALGGDGEEMWMWMGEGMGTKGRGGREGVGTWRMKIKGWEAG